MPDDPVALLSMSNYYVTGPARNLEKAFEYLERMRGNLKALDIANRMRLATCYIDLKYTKYALECFESVLQVAPDFIPALEGKEYILAAMHAEKTNQNE